MKAKRMKKTMFNKARRKKVTVLAVGPGEFTKPNGDVMDMKSGEYCYKTESGRIRFMPKRRFEAAYVEKLEPKAKNHRERALKGWETMRKNGTKGGRKRTKVKVKSFKRTKGGGIEAVIQNALVLQEASANLLASIVDVIGSSDGATASPRPPKRKTAKKKNPKRVAAAKKYWAKRRAKERKERKER